MSVECWYDCIKNVLVERGLLLSRRVPRRGMNVLRLSGLEGFVEVGSENRRQFNDESSHPLSRRNELDRRRRLWC